MRIASTGLTTPVDVSFWTTKRGFPDGSLFVLSIASSTCSGFTGFPGPLLTTTGFPPQYSTIETIISEKYPLTLTNASCPLGTRFATAISTASCPGTGTMMTSFSVLKIFWSFAEVSS